MTVNRSTPLNELPEWLTVVEAARWLGIARTSAYALVQQGRLPAVCFGTPTAQYPKGKILRVPRAALASLAQQQSAVPQ